MTSCDFVIVITARASFARVESFVNAINEQELVKFNFAILLTASSLQARYGGGYALIEKCKKYCQKVIVRDTLAIEEELNILDITKNQIDAVTETILNLKPSFIITVGDRVETLGTAIAASYTSTPLAHILAGERSGNIDDKVRFSVSNLSDYWICPSQSAKNVMLNLGCEQRKVFFTGCGSTLVASQWRLAKASSVIVKVKESLLNTNTQDFNFIKNKNYILVMLYPETPKLSGFKHEYLEQLLIVLNDRRENIIFIAPNADLGTEDIFSRLSRFISKSKKSKRLLIGGIDQLEFYWLIKNSSCLVGNSSTIVRESIFLGKPSLNLGNRQKGRSNFPNIKNVDFNSKKIQEAINQLTNTKDFSPNHFFGDEKNGSRFISAIEGILNDINHTSS